MSISEKLPNSDYQPPDDAGYSESRKWENIPDAPAEPSGYTQIAAGKDLPFVFYKKNESLASKTLRVGVMTLAAAVATVIFPIGIFILSDQDRTDAFVNKIVWNQVYKMTNPDYKQPGPQSSAAKAANVALGSSPEVPTAAEKMVAEAGGEFYENAMDAVAAYPTSPTKACFYMEQNELMVLVRDKGPDGRPQDGQTGKVVKQTPNAITQIIEGIKKETEAAAHRKQFIQKMKDLVGSDGEFFTSAKSAFEAHKDPGNDKRPCFYIENNKLMLVLDEDMGTGIGMGMGMEIDPPTKEKIKEAIESTKEWTPPAPPLLEEAEKEVIDNPQPPPQQGVNPQFEPSKHNPKIQVRLPPPLKPPQPPA
jgi:hypothetical protein